MKLNQSEFQSYIYSYEPDESFIVIFIWKKKIIRKL